MTRDLDSTIRGLKLSVDTSGDASWRHMTMKALDDLAQDNRELWHELNRIKEALQYKAGAKVVSEHGEKIATLLERMRGLKVYLNSAVAVVSAALAFLVSRVIK